MYQAKLLCLSLTPNLRCAGLTIGQSTALLIPLAIEVLISLLFVSLYSGPFSRAQILLAIDGILYLIWALLDMLSHVVSTARTSLSVFKVFDFLVGAVSFTPIFIYAIYLYRLSFLYFIPILPRKLQPYLVISLPMLSLVAVALNEVSSFVGIHLATTSSNHPLVVTFSNNSESLWLSLSYSSLMIWTVTQFLFFFLSLSRLAWTSLDEREADPTQSDGRHFLHGIAWISIGIILGVVETITGFAQVSFGVTLARRILRLVARTTLMFGLFKGFDLVENFENVTDGLHDVSQTSKHVSHTLSVDPQQTHVSSRISRACSDQSHEYPSTEKRPREQRVTIHYEKGQAPLLQIRFSTLEFPAHTMFAGSGAEPHRKSLSDEMAVMRNVMLETPRAKSAPATGNGDYDWCPPPIMSHARLESGESISDNLTAVRNLERKFPSLPSRMTGENRGSVLKPDCAEHLFPVFPHKSEEGGVAVAVGSSNSIKRKPAPPLLENIPWVSDRRKRPASTWGGLAQKSADSSAVPFSEGSTVHSPETTLAGEPTTPRSRKTANRNLFKRAGRALSDASVRSAEWLASTKSSQSSRTPLRAVDIEMYRKGNLGPGSARATPGAGEISLSDKSLPKPSRRFTDGAKIS